MNILIYTHIYPAPERFGIAPDTRVVHYFARDWQRMGHRVQVVLLNHWPVKELFQHDVRQLLPREDDYEIEGVPVHIFNYQLLTPHRRHPENFQTRRINAMLRRMKERLGWKADRVFVNFPTFAVGLTEIFAEDVPAIGVFHRSDMLNLERDDGPAVRDFLNRFKTWGCRNRQIGQLLEDNYGRKVVPVYSGIDAHLIAPPPVIEEKKTRSGSPLRLVYAGTLLARKKADDLIRAVRRLSVPFTLTIVGDGPERARLEALAEGDERILFQGRLSREETIARMREADVFVMVSTGETYGLVYLEAMGQGCLTVAGRGEGMDGIIRDGVDGFLITPGNVPAIAEVIAHIWAMPREEKARMLDAGYELARSMTSEKMSRRYLDANQ